MAPRKENYLFSSSLCYVMHTAPKDVGSSEAACTGTYLGMLNGVILGAMFLYMLGKLYRSNQRARAGYTKNTVSIDVHITLLEAVLVWAILWSLYEVFTFDDATRDLPPPSHMADGSKVVSTCAIYTLSTIFTTLIIMLLVTNSIGANTFRTAYVVAVSYGLLFGTVLALVIVFTPGPHSDRMLPQNVNLLMMCKNAIDLCFQLGAYLYTKRHAPDRRAVHHYVKFMAAMSVAFIVARILNTSYLMHHLDTAGLCVMDVTQLIYFIGFPPVVYLTLKRDSQYWMHDLADDEERQAMIDWGAETVHQELPVFEDVVIPKTELYLRKRLEDRMAIAIELFLWRRQLVIAKRFKLDFLTRDNIKDFKKEANVIRRLTHENIVRFFGVVIDPPCMSIVMEYGSNGDLFTHLAKLREQHVLGRRSSADARSPAADAVAAMAAGDASFGVFSSTALGSPDSKEPLLKGSEAFNPMRIAMDIASGMRYLHSHGMVHCDLKSANVVLDRYWTAKITDFGDVHKVDHRGSRRSSLLALVRGSSEHEEKEVEPSGTVPWAAPEVLGWPPSRPTCSSDAFSFGIVLWELMTWRVPFLLVGKVQEARRTGRVTTESPVHHRFGSADQEPADWQFSIGPKASRSERDRLERLQSDRYVLGSAGELSASAAMVGAAESRSRSNSFAGSRAGSRTTSFSDEGGVRGTVASDLLPQFHVAGELGRTFGHTTEHSRSIAYSQLEPTRQDRTGSSESGSASNHSSQRSYDDLSIVDAKSRLDAAPIEPVVVSTREQAFDLLVQGRYRPPLPIFAPAPLTALMRACWSHHPEERPNFMEVVNQLEDLMSSHPRADFPCEVGNFASFAER